MSNSMNNPAAEGGMTEAERLEDEADAEAQAAVYAEWYDALVPKYGVRGPHSGGAAHNAMMWGNA